MSPLRLLVVSALVLAAGVLQGAEELSKVPLVDMATLISYPRPEYPYEARQKRMIGSGVVLLDVNPATGVVIRARMAKSTGHRVLDEAALKALRAWRFKKGVPARQKTLITFSTVPARR